VRLPDPPLLLVTDRKQARLPLARVVERALAGGCRWISLREKDLPAVEQVVLASVLKPLARLAGACLTLHGKPELAMVAGVDGVHLPADADAAAARGAIGTTGLIGISVHSVTQACRVDPALVDYAIAGPAFETASKPGYGPALGARGTTALVRACPVPVIAIGGIEAANVADVLAAGAVGVAVMGGVMRAEAPEREVKGLLAALSARRQPRPR
jgi:thiamine-phosphate pyrophosphorylase